MKTICGLVLALLPVLAIAQDPASDEEFDLRGKLLEDLRNDTGSSLILDNTRTKVGKDFYDLFYTYWTDRTMPTDTNRQCTDTLVTIGLVILVEEIPSPGTANQIVISIDDQPVWEQFVQARYELLEEDALYALEVVRDYLASRQETQQRLNTRDQQGTGVY
ncbi:CsgE family curli-type amyloid fiber assembly protein [Fibrella arboris]|uniref:CsgE family curli-type amyloid fiber assembly protein n=1 Tax=Fibrella arboris TaxID=3242486 RepID=UPI0035229A63